MSHTYPPWYTNTRFFLTFFTENPLALKLFCSALLSIPHTRILSCHLRSPAFYHASDPPLIGVTITCPQTLHLDICPVFHQPIPHTVSLLPSVHALLPSTPFLRIFLVNTPGKALYSEVPSNHASCTVRFLNLSLLLPPLLHTPLYDFSHFLLLRHTSECPSLCKSAPLLSPIIQPINEYLKEREISSLFCEKNGFSSPGEIRFMCALNRRLLKEHRFLELAEASENPEMLMQLYEEYHRRGEL